MLRAVFAYRYFILSSIKGELRARYARSRLGAFWLILNPLAQSLMFAIVLSQVLGGRLPGVESNMGYAIYVLSGMAAWGLFIEVLHQSMGMFLTHAASIKKISFPKLSLPVIIVGASLVNHALLLAAIFLVLLALGHLPGLAWVYLPVGVVLTTMFAVGLGLICGVFNVFARDVGQVMGVATQLWFWGTPIIYPVNILPETFRSLVEWNPVTPLAGLYRNAILYNQPPDWGSLVFPFLLALVLMGAGFVLFRRASSDLVDAL